MTRTADDILAEHGIAPPPPGKQRYYAVCPRCSARRKRAHQRDKVLGVTVLPDGVKWGCNHCLWKGGAYYNGKINGPGGEPAATYDYLSEQGELLFQKVRNPPGSKQRFWQRRPDGKGGWINDTHGVRKVLYRLPEVIEAIASERTILLVEGEKDADNLWRIGIPATCSPDGAADTGRTPKWHMPYSESLRGADIVVLNDNDPAGYAHAEATASMSRGIAKRVRRLDLAKHWPEIPKGGDVSDWLAAGHTREELDALIEQAPDHDNSNTKQVPGARALQFVSMEEVKAKHVEWLWHNRLARGKLTLLAGDPGIGKSQVAVDIAARISSAAQWPDGGYAQHGGVVILSAEDSANDTLRPRLEAAGAKLGRVSALTATLIDGKPVTFSLQAHLEMLGAKLTEIGDVALIIIDPITSYMGKIDGHQTVDVRTVLEPLAAFAEKHNIAVLAISHPPKATQSKALHAVTGSLAFVAAARLVFIATMEPQTERRLLLAVKNNLGRLAIGIGFGLTQCLIGDDILTSHVVWDSAPVTTTADEAVAAANNEGPTAMKEAADFLRDELADEPRSVKDLKRAATDAGLSWRTVRRAQADLGIKPAKDGIAGGWSWALPKVANTGPEGGHS